MLCCHVLLCLLRCSSHTWLLVDAKALEELRFLGELFLRRSLLLGALLLWTLLRWSWSLKSSLVARGRLAFGWWVLERPDRCTGLQALEAMLGLHVWVTMVEVEVVGEVLAKVTHGSGWIQQHRLLLLLKGRRVTHQLVFHSFQVLGSLQCLVVLQTDLNSSSVLVIRVVSILVCLHLQSELLGLLLFLSSSFYFHGDLLLPWY